MFTIKLLQRYTNMELDSKTGEDIRHYDEGRNGFGIWFESQSAEISADVETIIKGASK